MKWWLLGIGTVVLIGVGWFIHGMIVAMRFFRESDTSHPRTRRRLDRPVRIPKRPR